jgi:hypothetical protein
VDRLPHADAPQHLAELLRSTTNASVVPNSQRNHDFPRRSIVRASSGSQPRQKTIVRRPRDFASRWNNPSRRTMSSFSEGLRTTTGASARASLRRSRK